MSKARCRRLTSCRTTQTCSTICGKMLPTRRSRQVCCSSRSVRGILMSTASSWQVRQCATDCPGLPGWCLLERDILEILHAFGAVEHSCLENSLDAWTMMMTKRRLIFWREEQARRLSREPAAGAASSLQTLLQWILSRHSPPHLHQAGERG